MKKNMGGLDKAIRFSLAAIVAILYFTKIINGNLAIGLGIIALIFALTSLVSFCPLYTFLGINTCKTK